jgi:hypothetical protein
MGVKDGGAKARQARKQPAQMLKGESELVTLQHRNS